MHHIKSLLNTKDKKDQIIKTTTTIIKLSLNDLRSNDTVRSIITFGIRRQQNNNAVNRNLTSVLNIWKNCPNIFLQDQ